MKKYLLALALVLAMSTTAAAALIDLPLTYSNVTGSGTYGALRLEDVNGSVVVSVNYNSSVFTPAAGSFGVQDVWLNLIPGSYSGVISLTQLGTEIDSANSFRIVDSGNGLKPDGLGFFSMNITSGTNSAGNRIPVASSSAGFTPLFSLAAGDLSVSDFLAFSRKDGENTLWYAALHLAGYDKTSFTGGESSSYLAATPIPGSLILFGSGLVAMAGVARRRFRA